MVKTPGFHPGNRGSIPGGAIKNSYIVIMLNPALIRARYGQAAPLFEEWQKLDELSQKRALSEAEEQRLQELTGTLALSRSTVSQRKLFEELAKKDA